MITNSYGFGPTGSGNMYGAPPEGASTTLLLTAALAGSSWNAAARSTLGAWDFGTNSQPPLLKYADYDGSGTAFDCNQVPTGACGTLIPGQMSLNVEGGPLSLESGETLTPGLAVQLSASIEDARAVSPNWRWRQLSGPVASLSGADSAQLSFTVPNAHGVLVFELTAATVEGREYGRRILSFLPGLIADADGNGLIEIDSLTMLHNMRHNLAGTSYRTSAGSPGSSLGCPTGTGCNGYELTGSLDFDADSDGSSWTGDGAGGYLLDAGDSRAPYFVVDEDGAGGWQPIGDWWESLHRRLRRQRLQHPPSRHPPRSTLHRALRRHRRHGGRPQSRPGRQPGGLLFQRRRRLLRRRRSRGPAERRVDRRQLRHRPGRPRQRIQ